MDNDELTSNQRPNSKYKLSKSNENTSSAEDNIIYHYNRERRLAKAPQEVKDLYSERKQSRFGILGVLVADKPRRMLLVIIILLCLVIMALSRFGYFDTTYVLGGNVINITGTNFDGTTIIVLRKTANDINSYTGHVDIAVSAVDTTVNTGDVDIQDSRSNVFYHRVFFTLEKEEVFRFAAPLYDSTLLMVLQTERNTLQIKFTPD
ncbi:MAG: hypothetical protein FWD24_04965 [Treponema sp.]|nr:hypothetical protein [Treponema sp.]